MTKAIKYQGISSGYIAQKAIYYVASIMYVI